MVLATYFNIDVGVGTSSGQSYKHFTSVIYDPRVVKMNNFLVSAIDHRMSYNLF